MSNDSLLHLDPSLLGTVLQLLFSNMPPLTRSAARRTTHVASRLVKASPIGQTSAKPSLGLAEIRDLQCCPCDCGVRDQKKNTPPPYVNIKETFFGLFCSLRVFGIAAHSFRHTDLFNGGITEHLANWGLRSRRAGRNRIGNEPKDPSVARY